MKKKSHFLLSFVFLLVLLIGIQSIYNPLFLWEELHFHFELFDLRGVAKGGIFLVTYLLATLSILILIAIRSWALFFLFLIFSFIFLSMDFFVQLLGVTHGFSLDEYRLSMNEMGNYKYLQAYADTIIESMILALFVVLLFYFIRTKFCFKRFSAPYLLFVVLFLGVVYGACYKVDTYKLSSYAAPIKIPAIALLYLQKSEPLVKRELDSTIKPETEGKFQNIVWIVDESVVGTYLGINGYEKETTPFLKAFNEKSKKVYNFGIVNSISNCSGESNLFLRIGMNPKQKFNVAKQMYTLPTIFQYAKRAGYTTWLFDSQTRKDHLQNYLTLYDKEDIDHFETLGPEVTRVKRDKKFLEDVATIVNNNKNGKNFIILVKYGAHFPYLLTYDHAYSPFQPVMQMSYGGMDMEHKEEQMNSYLNALYFNVDLYLKSLVETIDLSNNIVFYTSDHGQNILETENLTRPHCNSEVVVKNEVSVPLMVFQDRAKALFSSNQNYSYSQIQLFPTTLSLLGYDEKTVEKYGKTLFTGYTMNEKREYILSSSGEVKSYE